VFSFFVRVDMATSERALTLTLPTGEGIEKFACANLG